MVTTEPVCAVCGGNGGSQYLLPDANGNLLCWFHYKELYRPTSYPPMTTINYPMDNSEEWQRG